MEDAAELQRLLDIVKLCVYGRYVAMNFQDPCRHVKLAEKIAIPGARKEYTLKDFEKLKICPMDFYKILAIILIFGGAGCCWIIMWMGSYASKVLFPHSNLHDSLLYKPGAVYAISDLSYRDETDVPPEMRIVSPGLWNPHPHPHPPPHTDGGSGPIAAAGGSGTSTGSPTPSIPSTTMANIRTKLLAVHRLMPVGTVNRKASNHGLLETMSIMNIAPNMVIRPPAGASTGVTTTTTPTRASTTTNTTAQTDQASTWFHSINDDM
ncbi:uncharacterized protein LOC118437581 [Folsomia candida]|nr:uncharacterized protein LOC118437581 [Folsomia candida]